MIKKRRKLKPAIFSKPAFIFIYYIILTLIVTYPLFLHLRTNIAGYHDAWQFVWNFWWVKTALIKEHASPLFTNYLHYPNGISLLFHTLSLTNSLVAIPLQYIFGLIGTYNLLLIFNFALNGYATYCLANYLTKNKFAAFIAGVIVAFSPYMITHSYGHLNLMSFGWVVFFILYFIKMVKKEGSWILPALFIVLTGLSDWYYFSYIGLFIILYLIFLAIAERKLFQNKRFAINFLLMIFAGLLVLSPYLGQMIYKLVTDNNYNVLGHDPLIYSNDLISFIVPSYTSRFAGSFSHFWQSFPAYWESVAFLGFSVIALVLGALLFIRKSETYFWFAVLMIFAVLSLGPHLSINSHLYGNITLPYAYMEKLPFMQIQGVPARYAIMVYLTAAILAAFSISAILSKKTLTRFIIIGIFIALIIIEYLPAPYFVSRIPIEAFYQSLAQDKEDYVILDRSAEEPKILYFQTIHNKKLIGGYTSRPTNQTYEFLQKTPVISNLYNGYESDSLNPDDKQSLKDYKVKYVIIYSWDKSRTRIAEQLGLSLKYKSAWIKVYEVD